MVNYKITIRLSSPLRDATMANETRVFSNRQTNTMLRRFCDRAVRRGARHRAVLQTSIAQPRPPGRFEDMSPEFRDYLLDQLAPMGPVRARRMFGGGGLFLDDMMFALVVDDVLYFKVDDGNRAPYETADMKPFTYKSRARTVALSYFEVPPELIEDAEDLTVWARAAWDAALRSGTKKKRKKGAAAP